MGVPGFGAMVTPRTASRALAEPLRLQHLVGPEALGSPYVERHSKERSMSISSSDQSNRTRRPRALPPFPHKSFDDREWDERVAREVRHQAVIEASFDRAEAYARVGDFEQALAWLDRAATLSGGLPPAYRARRARWALSTAVRLRPTRGDRNARGSDGLQGT